MNDQTDQIELWETLGLDNAVRAARRQVRQTPAEAEAEETAKLYESLGLYYAAASVRAGAKLTPEGKEENGGNTDQG